MPAVLPWHSGVPEPGGPPCVELTATNQPVLHVVTRAGHRRRASPAWVRAAARWAFQCAVEARYTSFSAAGRGVAPKLPRDRRRATTKSGGRSPAPRDPVPSGWRSPPVQRTTGTGPRPASSARCASRHTGETSARPPPATHPRQPQRLRSRRRPRPESQNSVNTSRVRCTRPAWRPHRRPARGQPQPNPSVVPSRTPPRSRCSRHRPRTRVRVVTRHNRPTHPRPRPVPTAADRRRWSEHG